MKNSEYEISELFEGILLSLAITGFEKIKQNLKDVVASSKYAHSILETCMERKSASQIAQELNIGIGNLNKYTTPLLQTHWLNVQAKGKERIYKSNPLFEILNNMIEKEK